MGAVAIRPSAFFVNSALAARGEFNVRALKCSWAAAKSYCHWVKMSPRTSAADPFKAAFGD